MIMIIPVINVILSFVIVVHRFVDVILVVLVMIKALSVTQNSNWDFNKEKEILN